VEVLPEEFAGGDRGGMLPEDAEDAAAGAAGGVGRFSNVVPAGDSLLRARGGGGAAAGKELLADAFSNK
jgi:hypothetical protein